MNENKIILTNFLDIFEHSKKILIPSIQRNYVQGNNENIREKLIKNIFEVIQDEKKFINLDIIYGVKSNDAFIPIDGQQRLTTLFLFYWYIAVKNWENGGEQLLNIIDITYENKISSREFFELLKNQTHIKEKILKDQQDKKISEIIKNSTDYYASKWNKDITIKSALKMLDEIEICYKKCNNYNIIEKVIDDTKNNKIFFRCKFLNINDKSDAELYIKMNSRGKMLSKYEILKAQLEKIAFSFKDIDNKKYIELCSNFDNKWANIFLRNINISNKEENDKYSILEKIEKNYYNFLKIFITNYFIENALNMGNDQIENIKKFKKQLIEGIKEIKFKEEGIFKINSDFYNKLENVMKKIIFLNSNNPCENCKNVIEIMDLEKLWETNLSENIDLRSSLYFYAIMKYLETNQTIEDLTNNYDYFQNWIRVIRNYINSNYHIQIADTSKKEANSIYFRIMENIKVLSSRLEKYPNIIEYFANDEEDKKELKLPDDDTWLETEIRKSKYILNEPETWGKAILEADKDKYFCGINYFLFEFEKDNVKNFERYQKITEEIFSEQNEYLIQRAMLTVKDYLQNLDNGIRTFYVFNFTDNTNTWIAGLNYKRNNILRKELKDFIDKYIKFSPEKEVQAELQNVIDKYLQKKEITSWKYYFIKDKRLFAICQGGNIKFEQTTSEDVSENINIIKTVRNSKHWDYLSLFLKLKLEDILNDDSVRIYYSGKTGSTQEFDLYNALKIYYKNVEYTFLRKKDGKYNIQLKENGDIYYSFNYDIITHGNELNKEEERNISELLNNSNIQIKY